MSDARFLDGSGATLARLSGALDRGEVSCVALVDEALAAIRHPAGEGARAFLRVRDREAPREAAAADRARQAGRLPGPLHGLPLSVKDLFDVAGEVTTAGSRVLADRPPAHRHADAVARLLDAGAILVGRTNMTEFAYSGLGLNPHYGTPASPWRREERHVPGGSSSGAAVSVSDGMCAAAIGTDTGGSTRIPAAFCGIVGFKPTARRVSTRGAVPLSTTLDSVGPLARSVDCCARLDAVMAGDRLAPLPARAPASLALGVARRFFLDDADAPTAAAFERALSRLAAAGVRLVDLDLPPLQRLPAINANGGFSAIESWHWHQDLLAARGDEYDPRVAARIRRGRSQGAADLARLAAERQAFVADMAPLLRTVDAVATLAVPIAPPRIDALSDDAAYGATNLLVLRNTGAVNFLDGCALSIPCHAPGESPAGLMLFAGALGDRALLAAGAAVEAALATARA